MFDYIRHPDETPRAALVRTLILAGITTAMLAITGSSQHHTIFGWVATFISCTLGVVGGTALIKVLSEIKVKP